VSNLDTPTGGHPLDDVAAYALHALDDAERRAVDAHLAVGAACRDELATHYETLVLLAPEEAPPAALWDRVNASIGAPVGSDDEGPADAAAAGPGLAGSPGSGSTGSDDVVRPMPTRSPTPRPAAPAQPGRPSRLGWVAAAAAVAVALGVGGLVGHGLGSADDDADIGTLAARAAQQPGGELATLLSPDGGSVARVVVDDDGAYLVLDDLDNLPEGRAYQLWSVTEAQPVSLGMLGRDGTNTVAFRLPPTITDLAISEAPTSGDVTPRGDFIASGPILRT